MADEEEEEVVDPKIKYDEQCAKTKHCVQLLIEYEACAERIEKKGEGQCSGQYMDYQACIDSCAKNKIFENLK